MFGRASFALGKLIPRSNPIDASYRLMPSARIVAAPSAGDANVLGCRVREFILGSAD